MVKNPPAIQETWVGSLGWEDPLEEGMATYSSILAWRIPVEPGRLQSMGSQRAGHNGVAKQSTKRGKEIRKRRPLENQMQLSLKRLTFWRFIAYFLTNQKNQGIYLTKANALVLLLCEIKWSLLGMLSCLSQYFLNNYGLLSWYNIYFSHLFPLHWLTLST